MPIAYPQIVDANLNRVSEGLRVIEEYVRFIAKNKPLTDTLAALRRQIAQNNPSPVANLAIRNAELDMRAKEPPAKRETISALLKANFGRVKEGLRVLEEYTGQAVFNGMRYDVYELEREIVLTLLKKPIRRGIYLISDDPAVLLKGSKMSEVAIIQLRDKAASKSQIYQKAHHIKSQLEPDGIPFILNDYLDIALDLDLDGLHTGQDDLSLTTQRKLLGPHKLLGRTTHSLQQGLRAQEEGADYVSLGPIWETPSKPDRNPIGFEYLEKANDVLQIPFVAIGGISAKNSDKIAQFNPPLVGIIRAFNDIQKIHQAIFKHA